jgi:hypothetical protein
MRRRNLALGQRRQRKAVRKRLCVLPATVTEGQEPQGPPEQCQETARKGNKLTPRVPRLRRLQKWKGTVLTRVSREGR